MTSSTTSASNFLPELIPIPTPSHLQASDNIQVIQPSLAMSDKLKDAVLAEANSARAASQEVLKSGAYLYPFKVNHGTP